ncbi:diacylglycerol/lipid kinase family protein [Planctomycetota bacterium]
MNVEIIFNPISGRGRAASLAGELQTCLLARGHKVNTVATGGSGDAARLAAALPGNTEVLAVVGGDGTVNEVVNGMPLELPLLLCPCGTANVLARELHYPQDVAAIAGMLEVGQETEIDLGELNGHRFTLMLGAGFDGSVIHELSRLREGSISFIDYARPIWWSWKNSQLEAFSLEVDGRQVYRGTGTVVLCNVAGYAGLFKMDPEACFDDGLLNAVLVKADSKMKYLEFAAGLFTGTHLGLNYVEVFLGAQFRITGAVPLPVQLDGEAFGYTPCEVQVRRRALRIISPVSLNSA